ncbi:MAG: aminotransferase class IV [Saprospiraceae bacterium]|jgi:4-amino-4-deoxychorismate lyase|nr:aminotransferase class IV [Saprospiraceae bacterium]
MSLLVETIKLDHGCFINADLHEHRLNLARKFLFGILKPLSLVGYLRSLDVPVDGHYKCRIIYAEDIVDYQISPSIIRTISTLRLVTNNDIVYSFKFLKRVDLDALFLEKGNADEILVCRNGLITDAYYYNVVFQKGDDYFTPSSPLLEGIQRQFLLNTQRISKKNIKAGDIYKYDYIHLINALTPLHAIKISVDHIII